MAYEQMKGEQNEFQASKTQIDNKVNGLTETIKKLSAAALRIDKGFSGTQSADDIKKINAKIISDFNELKTTINKAESEMMKFAEKLKAASQKSIIK